MSQIPSFADVEEAARRLEGVAVRTPLLRSDALDAACGGRVWLKAECLQRTGSFKFRGAYNRISRLSDDEKRRGVVAFSSGNHAQGVAAAAKLVGCPAVIVMPADAPAIKIASTRGFGAEVVLYDRRTESREAIGEAIAAERGSVLVPPFEDFHVIAGQGTAGLEAARQMAEVGEIADLVVCPASGGGLIAGVGLAFGALSPDTRIIVAEPKDYDDHGLSLEAGRRTTISPSRDSLCDALMQPEPGEMTWSLNGGRLAGAAAVTDDEALTAMAEAFARLKIVLEPGGAVALAAVLTGKVGLEGRTAVVIGSGGNVDPAVFARAISG